jgi:hypothetical protein
MNTGTMGLVKLAARSFHFGLASKALAHLHGPFHEFWRLLISRDIQDIDGSSIELSCSFGGLGTVELHY